MLRTIFILMGLFVSVHLYSQKQLVIRNQQTNSAIPFAAVVASNYMTVSDEFGQFKLPDRIQNQVSIQHVSFQTIVFDASKIKNNDTLYLVPTIYQVNEVEVNYNLLDEYCQLLSKAINNYRSNVLKSDTSFYTYYLESENDSMAVEKIKTVLQLKSNKKSGLYLSENYLKQGEFWYNPLTPYLNLSTEKFILSFNALASKYKSSPWFMPLNSVKAIKTKHYAVDIIRAFGDTLTLSVSSAGGNKQAHVTFNKHDLSIYEVEFLVDSLLNHNLYDINTGKRVGVQDLKIKYFFNHSGEIKFIQYKMSVFNNPEHRVWVQGYFNKSALSALPIINIFAGDYYPDNLYEQIILTGKNNLLDSIFDVNNYKGYVIPDSVGLKSADSTIIHRILNIESGNDNYSFWKKHRISTGSYNLYEIDHYYYDPLVRQIEKESNRLSILWAFNLLNHDNEFSVNSFPSMWYKNNQLLYTSSDTITTDLNANLIFDLYEIQKRKVYDSIKTMNSVVAMDSYVKKAYYDFNLEMDNLIVHLSKEEVDYEQFCQLNALVRGKLAVDNFALWFSQKSIDTANCIFLKQQYEHVRHAYLKYLKNNTDTLYFKAYTQSMIDITKVIISLNRRISTSSNMEQASYYHFLAEYYFSINAFDKVCKYVKIYKELSPVFYAKQNTKVDGVYIGSQPKAYFKRNCE